MLDLIVEFDEMGFAPTTVCPNPEEYAGAFRNRIINCNEEEIKQAQIDMLATLEKEIKAHSERCYDWDIAKIIQAEVGIISNKMQKQI